MKTNLIYILGMMCLSGTVSAQTTVNYTEFEQKVLDYSQTLKQSVSQRTAMQKAMKAAKTAFFPAVDATGSYQYRINKYDMDLVEWLFLWSMILTVPKWELSNLFMQEEVFIILIRHHKFSLR